MGCLNMCKIGSEYYEPPVGLKSYCVYSITNLVGKKVDVKGDIAMCFFDENRLLLSATFDYVTYAGYCRCGCCQM